MTKGRTDPLLERATAAVARLSPCRALGRVAGIGGSTIAVTGLSRAVGLGDRARLHRRDGPALAAEVVRIEGERVHLLPEDPGEGLVLGDPVTAEPAPCLAPDCSWVGRVMDPDGRPLDGRPLLPGLRPRPLRAAPPPAGSRRGMGPRLATGLSVFDTILPVARGQRIGLFAGSGVGKSTLLGDLARGVAADLVVVALAGERGRELGDFLRHVLGEAGLARAVVVAATSDRAPQVRRRCVWAATAVAEHFRDEGAQVLLLVDSVTRFAEAHRELAVAAGEPAGLRGFPATTPALIASLCERAGPGGPGQGDITAIYSVLVQGSDMEEPVADWLRGVLDGHVVLDRAIAERGRFPAIDPLRSVSRALPQVTSTAERETIAEARAAWALLEEAGPMLRAGLYQPGSDPALDAALAVRDPLERFLALRDVASPEMAFRALRDALARRSGRPET
ncbi:FliI/YscN family ATPase [Rubellimicrobium sp. CFH 75288]|uniref:FliI/YscN family ATPase n=1 Tax=Rubellimicrobium sp. CFH 75288 TaxID=2697034 RepID=UPI0014123BD8|nr:FliI/YscN family ATPase [Rubellimicrobium sp. CFH 75288]NAZ37297.1 FliI/YscN family ATPase [Rubellimicrobium sp. CFH 75288]